MYLPAVANLAPMPARGASVEEEMRKSYVDYAMSVIVSRALPDARDGMKPVHRRILFGMYEGGYTASKPMRKSARVVGDVMGKYHPHGDAAIYDAMVRMAQPFSTRVLLIEGQGNFGSPDGDPPAAMRYTEARMARITDETVVADLDEDTVPFRPTYDEENSEPKVLPVRFPVLLVNGGQGIAVGMATSIAPHNLGEVIDGTIALLDDPDISVEGLMRFIQGPDFPTGGVILGRGGIRMAFETGRGSVTMSSVYTVEPLKGGKQAIIITELPYQVNKALMLEALAKLVNERTIEGIVDLRDESADGDVRVVVELKREANAELVLTKLRKLTDFEKNFSTNATCLDSHGKPCVMGLKQMLVEFVNFRIETIKRRTEFRLEKARTDLNTEVGKFAAQSQIDEVVRRIRASRDAESARTSIMEMQFPTEGELATLLAEVDPDVEVPVMFRLSEAQARTILSLSLSSLTALEGEKIASDARGYLARVKTLLAILAPGGCEGVMRTEMAEIKAKYSTPRLTRIESAGPSEIDEDDLIEDKQVVLTLTRQGYVKVTDLSGYREQKRGGMGKTGMDTKDDDFVTNSLVCSTRTNLIIFTSRGIAHTIKAYKLPMAAANGKGRPLVNFLSLREGESVATVMPMPAPSEVEGRFMVFVTDRGDVRRNAVADFSRVQSGGKVAMKLEDENGHSTARLISVLSCTEADDLVLATRRGKAVRFPVTDIRVFKGRESMGNMGITLAKDDTVISACIVRHFEASAQEREAYFNDGVHTWKDDDGSEQTLKLTSERVQEMRSAEETLLTVTALGYGKRFSTHDFRTTGRGTQGVWVGTFGAASGDLVSLQPVIGPDGLMLVTNGGQAIRTRCAEIKVMGRSARGVKLFDLPSGQVIVDVACVPADDEAPDAG